MSTNKDKINQLRGLGVATEALFIKLLDERTLLIEGLKAATAYAELFTGNGVLESPPEWAITKSGEISAQLVAVYGRSLLRKVAE